MKISGILFVLSLYGLQGSVMLAFLSGEAERDGNWYLVLGLTVLSGILGLWSIFSVLLGGSNLRQDGKRSRHLNNGALAMKLLLVPFWVIHFAMWALVSMAFLVVPGLLILLPLNLVGVLVAYFALLVSSAYTGCSIYIHCRRGALSRKQCVWGIVLQLIFALDVLSYLLYFCFAIRRGERRVALAQEEDAKGTGPDSRTE